MLSVCFEGRNGQGVGGGDSIGRSAAVMSAQRRQCGRKRLVFIEGSCLKEDAVMNVRRR